MIIAEFEDGTATAVIDGLDFICTDDAVYVYTTEIGDSPFIFASSDEAP